MFKRIVVALESIAESLKKIVEEIHSMKEDQTKFMELSKHEAEKAPARLLEIFNSVKNNLSGGKEDGK